MGLEKIEHLVVLMLENRSFDSVLGRLYAEDDTPTRTVPETKSPAFDGLRDNAFGNLADNGGETHWATSNAASAKAPMPAPSSRHADVLKQIDGTADSTTPMSGFVANYAEATGTEDPGAVMAGFGPAQVPILSALARAYAVCDGWFASVPGESWPNRAFVHAGTSNGHVDTWPHLSEAYSVKTVFEALTKAKKSWGVYGPGRLMPLTRLQFPALWAPKLDKQFKSLAAFEKECASGKLPTYSFLEPDFLIDPSDGAPGHDMAVAEALVHRVYNAVRGGKAWSKTVMVITAATHGGCYDHVAPPAGAVPPDAASKSGDAGFGFDRFGVRVPTLVISPWVAPGTVFTSPIDAPFDHTSILATLREMAGLPADFLSSARVTKAPTLATAMTCSEPRTDTPDVPAPAQPNGPNLPASSPASEFQVTIAVATAGFNAEMEGYVQHDPDVLKDQLRTVEETIDHCGADPRQAR